MGDKHTTKVRLSLLQSVKPILCFSLNVNKIEDAGELPGLMIEEMMESASMVDMETGDTKDTVKMTDGSIVDGSVKDGVVAVKSKTPLKWRQSTPLNTAVLFVPQQEAWIVERMGK